MTRERHPRVAGSRGEDPPDPATPPQAATRAAEGGDAGLDVGLDAGPSVTVAAEDEPEVDAERVRRLARSVLRAQGIPAAMSVDVLFVDVDAMTDLNVEHMDGDGPTDVLAFPIDMPDDVVDGVPAMLGDVVLCRDVAAAQAATAGKSVDDELDMLLVHGILHLLGYDHQEEDERRVMFGLTDSLLAEFADHGGTR